MNLHKIMECLQKHQIRVTLIDVVRIRQRDAVQPYLSL